MMQTSTQLGERVGFTATSLAVSWPSRQRFDPKLYDEMDLRQAATQACLWALPLISGAARATA